VVPYLSLPVKEVPTTRSAVEAVVVLFVFWGEVQQAELSLTMVAAFLVLVDLHERAVVAPC
jgi:hypothetical protein